MGRIKQFFSRAPSNAQIGITLGIAYGLLIRIGFEFKSLSSVFQIISTSFLFLMPLAVGAIPVYFASRQHPLTVRQQIGVSLSTMLAFLICMFLLLLEGVICIVLVAPVYFVAAAIGGLLMGLVMRFTSKSRSALNSIAILPLLVSPIEGSFPVRGEAQTVKTSVVIAATPEEIFHQLATVKNIDRDELGFSFMHLIGLPRPLEASMHGHGAQAVRTSRWDKGVTFKEKITLWNAPYQMHYQFEIPPGSVPREALDRHVELGGEYFTVLHGGYDIQPIDRRTSRLILRTTYLNKSHLTLYGNVWADIVLDDFHRSILGLMKHRAERAHRENKKAS